MPDQHALLAPSAAKRWMTCHPSARLEAREPERDTVFSKEGTVAHSIAELLLRFYRDKRKLPVSDILLETAGWGGNDRFLLSSFSDQAAQLGLDYAQILTDVHDNYVTPVIMDFLESERKEGEAHLYIEERIDLGTFIPEGFGSSDAILVAGKTMVVYDLKYGKGVKVEAIKNPQIMCYALGALTGVGELYPIETVEMCIIQPRLNHVSRWAVSADELRWWGFHVLKPNALAAWQGEGDQVPGDHCRFCKVAGKCKALAQAGAAVAKEAEDPAVLTPWEVSGLLEKVALFKNWIDKLSDYAMDLAREGKLPNWKIVEGRSVRKISDPEAAIKALQDAGFGEDFYLKPKELRTITDLERLLRKKGFQEILGPYVVKPAGAPTLAPSDDPRPAITSVTTDFDNINP